MAYIFLQKTKEEQKRLSEVKSMLDNLIRKWINEITPYKRHVINKYKVWVVEIEQKIKRWEYLHIRSLNKISNKDIDIDELKVEVRIEQFFNIKEKGHGKTMVCCPIHNDKTPSCAIYHDTNSYYCFGCNSGGSVIDLFIDRDGVSVKEAINCLIELK